MFLGTGEALRKEGLTGGELACLQFLGLKSPLTVLTRRTQHHRLEEEDLSHEGL